VFDLHCEGCGTKIPLSSIRRRRGLAGLAEQARAWRGMRRQLVVFCPNCARRLREDPIGTLLPRQ